MKRVFYILAILAVMISSTAAESNLKVEMIPGGTAIRASDSVVTEPPATDASAGTAIGTSSGTSAMRKCADYSVNSVTKNICAVCGDGKCEEYEKCTSTSCVENACTADCGQLYCPSDCDGTITKCIDCSAIGCEDAPGCGQNQVKIDIPSIFTLEEGQFAHAPDNNLKIYLERTIVEEDCAPEVCKERAIVTVIMTGGCLKNSDATDICMKAPSAKTEYTLFLDEPIEFNGIVLTVTGLKADKASFKIAFTESSCGNGVCEAGEDDVIVTCPEGAACAPSYKGSCPQDCACKPQRCSDGSVAKCQKSGDTCVCPTCPPITVKAPICKNVGTRSEGWYLEDKLVKYDNCACIAVCKGGPEGKGFYNSCSGSLIQEVDCMTTATMSVTIRSKKLEVSNTGEAVEIRSESNATTTHKLTVTDTGIAMETSSGNVDIQYLPEEAETKAVSSSKLTKVDKIELKEENGKAVYEITGEKQERFLWIFPVTSEATVKVDAATNEVVS
jgi:uncharacterized membrane protein YkoI